jgi:hypothetical protein
MECRPAIWPGSTQRADANPLENINNKRRIAEVYLRGTKLDRAAMRASFTGQ